MYLSPEEGFSNKDLLTHGSSITARRFEGETSKSWYIDISIDISHPEIFSSPNLPTLKAILRNKPTMKKLRLCTFRPEQGLANEYRVLRERYTDGGYSSASISGPINDLQQIDNRSQLIEMFEYYASLASPNQEIFDFLIDNPEEESDTLVIIDGHGSLESTEDWRIGEGGGERIFNSNGSLERIIRRKILLEKDRLVLADNDSGSDIATEMISAGNTFAVDEFIDSLNKGSMPSLVLITSCNPNDLYLDNAEFPIIYNFGTVGGIADLNAGPGGGLTLLCLMNPDCDPLLFYRAKKAIDKDPYGLMHK